MSHGRVRQSTVAGQRLDSRLGYVAAQHEHTRPDGGWESLNKESCRGAGELFSLRPIPVIDFIESKRDV